MEPRKIRGLLFFTAIGEPTGIALGFSRDVTELGMSDGAEKFT